MRVLFVTNPEKTFFLYMAPLAWALRTAGHDVQVASQPSFAGVITQAGLTAAPLGRDVELVRIPEIAGADQTMVEAARAGLPEPYTVADGSAAPEWERMRHGYAEMVRLAHKPENFPIIAGLVEYARRWQPDLIIWEPFTYAGPIAAKACGAAHARLLWSVDVFGVARDHFLRLRAAQPPDRRDDPLAEWLASYGRKYGYEFTEDMTTGQVTIDQLPPSLGIPADLPYLPMQYIPYGGPATVPQWLWARPQRPRVALTLGITATSQFAGYTVDVQGVLDQLAALDDLRLEIVATIAEPERAKLQRIPACARVVPYVPLHALAPTCAAVIHHGGAATLATTARHPVPQLVVGYHFDEPILARKLAAHGAGLALDPDDASGERVRDGLLRLLGEPGFRVRAGELRDEIRALPTPNQVVPQLEDLATKHRSR